MKFPLTHRSHGGGGPARRGLAGNDNRRIIAEAVTDGIERTYHATKGWRRRRVAPAKKAAR